MASEKITAEVRTEFGKGAARRIRRAGKVPAVIHGHGNDPIHLTLPTHETVLALRHGGANALLDLQFDGGSQLALTKDVQVDPVRRDLEHVDFVAVRRGEKVTVDIPIHVVGDAVPDSIVMTDHDTVQVEAEATHIPEWIEVSVQDAEIGHQVLAADLDLPDGTTLLTEADALIVNVALAKEEPEPETEEAEEAAAGEDAAEGGEAEAESGDDE